MGDGQAATARAEHMGDKDRKGMGRGKGNETGPGDKAGEAKVIGIRPKVKDDGIGSGD